jgi:hypothetical protein
LVTGTVKNAPAAVFVKFAPVGAGAGASAVCAL